MTEPQPGWYPDPADAARQRYWAGDAWTAETRDSTVPAASPAQAGPAADPYARYAQNATGTTTVPVYKGPAASPAVAAPLSGWWWRVLAFVMDYIILSVVQTVYQPLIPHLTSGLTQWMQDLLDAAMQGSATLPSVWNPDYQLGQAMMISAGTELVLLCLYFGLMTAIFGATVGQMACGLRVVPVDKTDAPRGLPAGPVVVRVLLQMILPFVLLTGGGFLVMDQTSASYYTLGGALAFAGIVYAVLNYLWAAWDPKRQCIHDKAARTQVVRPAR